MTTTLTGRLVGRLDVDCHRPDWVADGETGTAPTFYWPRDDTYLQNDGQLYKWMTEGDDYRLEHDGIGWVVTRGPWPYDGHVYRLARGGEFVDTLPLADGHATLDRGHRYAIHCSSEQSGPVFDLHEIA